MKKSSISIYDFVNHRTFLKTIYEDLKFHNPGVSYKTIQEAAGYSGKSNHLWQILEGLTPISDSSIMNYGKALLLTSREIKYFTLMVSFDKAKNDKDRDAIICQMKNSKLFSRAHHDYVNLFDIYSTWYLPVLWDMVQLDDFQEDHEWIVNKFLGKVSIVEARKGIEALLVAGVLVRDENGVLQQSSSNALDLSEKTKKDRAAFFRVLIRKHIRKMLELLPDAMESQPFDKRIFYTSTVVLSKDEIEMLKKKIFSFIREIEGRDATKAERNMIYQLNIQFFSHTSFED